MHKQAKLRCRNSRQLLLFPLKLQNFCVPGTLQPDRKENSHSKHLRLLFLVAVIINFYELCDARCPFVDAKEIQMWIRTRILTSMTSNAIPYRILIEWDVVALDTCFDEISFSWIWRSNKIPLICCNNDMTQKIC